MSERKNASGLDQEFQTLHEFVKAARMRLTPMIWDYLVGGTETETTLARNRMSLDSIALRPRVLNDVSRIDATATILGHAVRLPVFLAPVGSLESFDPGAGITAARAAARFGAGIMQSSVNRLKLEDVAAAGARPTLYQLYVRGDDSWIDRIVEQTEAAGYHAFCITVDTAVYSRRERDIAKRFVKSWRTDATGIEHQAALSWKSIAHVRKHHRIPLILKGIGTAEDARIAVEHGIDVVYCSNHGGRQLDHGLGSIEVLPEVVDAVAGRARVWVDGGFSRGTDIVKAIAMGAEAVGLGRLYCYALAAAGEAGVVRMLEILEDEVVSALGLLGVARLADVGPAQLRHGARPAALPSVHSAFPLLNLDDEGYGGR